MSNVGAYIELKPGKVPPLHPESMWVEGELLSRDSEGIDVEWEAEYPEGAQVYLAWEPKVYVVWEEDNGDEVGDVGDAVADPDGGGSGETFTEAGDPAPVE